MQQLELLGQLQLEFNEERLTVDSDGGDAVLVVPSIGCALRVYRSLPGGTPGPGIEKLVDLMAAAGLGVRVRIGARTVASAGAGRRPSRVLKLLGLPPVTLHWSAAIRSLLRI